MTALHRVWEGLLAGAAGTTALNAVTYLDMAIRGRPASETPQSGVERLSAMVRVPVPGDEKARRNRLEGLGPLLGLAVGLTGGVLTAAVTGSASGRSRQVTAAIASVTAMAAGNVPMALLGISDPREWKAADWAADIVPHLAYGAAVAAALAQVRGRP